ncbi:hypothetical protein V2H45_13910 [Tumidithrix elongata RA019]|uniref:Uncharacterized protein n=1 Tax=Tumidithrix elongata BACA0141 TaxID=2716417 RepID=A0AAW9Q3Q9_9CYAN|nr:hypothetical protein [Tumidithrix elongata RA019]
MTFQSTQNPTDTLSFEQAIAYTEKLLNHTELTDADLQAEITNLVATENGARGFFVCYLTGDWQLADRPSEGIIRALQAVPEPGAELLVKNLAMSTAMAIAHRRMDNETQAQGSDRVAKRTAHLMTLLNLDEIDRLAKLMYASAQAHEVQTGSGRDHGQVDDDKYSAFLKKWGYDREQKDAIQTAIAAIFR